MAKPNYTLPLLGAGGLLAAYYLFMRKPSPVTSGRLRRWGRASDEG